MEKLEFTVGQKVEGYGILNEYGQFDFTPKQKCPNNSGGMKLVKETEDYSFYESETKYKVTFTFEKSVSKERVIKNFLRATHKAAITLKQLFT